MNENPGNNHLACSSILMAFTGQEGMQSPQPLQTSMLTRAVVIPPRVSLKEIAPCSHYSSHVR
ncbi:MAG: hypothetical protein ACKVG9_11010, partial [Rhodospirillales bacterium]